MSRLLALSTGIFCVAFVLPYSVLPITFLQRFEILIYRSAGSVVFLKCWSEFGSQLSRPSTESKIYEYFHFCILGVIHSPFDCI